MELTADMVWVLGLTLAVTALFVWEKIPADIVALIVFCALVVFGLIDRNDAFSVFGNEAPITVAAMFALSFALIKTGALDFVAEYLGKHAGNSEIRSILIFFLTAGLCSAFVNNTPIVAVFMPLVLRHARNSKLHASRLLIPLSYASIFGGVCTLIGTSTNLVVHGYAKQNGLPGFTMFELAKIGIPLSIIGCLYLAFFGRKLLPIRETLTTLLPPDERKPLILQLLVTRDSVLMGQKLLDVEWLCNPKKAGVRILEVRREGSRLMDSLGDIQIRELDRFTVTVAHHCVLREGGSARLKIGAQSEKDLGVETLTPVGGRIVEAVVTPVSSWIGKTLKTLQVRSHHALQVLAVHRAGKNLTEHFADYPLKPGDTMLLVGATHAIEDVSHNDEDLILLEGHEETTSTSRLPSGSSWISIGVILGVVLISTLGWVPISVAALFGCVVLVLTKVLNPKELYRSIDWSILMIIFGTLALGLAMDKCGAARWLAMNAIEHLQGFIPQEWMPFVMLSFFIFMTSLLTEFISNNGSAALLAPLALRMASELGVSPMPFLIGVALAASASFSTPIGYQTNTMVYGAGGYTFKDFVKIGLPLNLLYWIAGSVLIPMIWKF